MNRWGTIKRFTIVLLSCCICSNILHHFVCELERPMYNVPQIPSILHVLISDLEMWLPNVLQLFLSPALVLQASETYSRAPFQWLQVWPTNSELNVFVHFFWQPLMSHERRANLEMAKYWQMQNVHTFISSWLCLSSRMTLVYTTHNGIDGIKHYTTYIPNMFE